MFGINRQWIVFTDSIAVSLLIQLQAGSCSNAKILSNRNVHLLAICAAANGTH